MRHKLKIGPIFKFEVRDLTGWKEIVVTEIKTGEATQKYIFEVKISCKLKKKKNTWVISSQMMETPYL